LKAWAQDVLGPSQGSKVEFAGKLYQLADGSWSYTPSIAGTEDNSRPQDEEQWAKDHGAKQTFDIHSHGSYDGLSDAGKASADTFSLPDRTKSNNWLNPQPQFLLTPGGDIKEYLPTFTTGADGGGGQIENLGNINGTLPLIPATI